MLHILHRPTTLKNFIGNEATVKSLDVVLSRKEGIPHAFLFVGNSGCGKTTLARIAATRLGIKPTDLKEYDSATFRGIDTIREISQMMKMQAMDGKRRAFLLDECHQLSKDAQNALLKALEDTPPHVYFLLCTTDPQKLIKTLVGRCQQYAVESLSKEVIVTLLKRVIKAENVPVPNEVLEQIAASANGSPRIALVTLDKIIDLPEADMLTAAQQVEEVERESIELCRALMNNPKWKDVSAILRGLQEAEVEQVRQAVLGYCNKVILSKDSPRAYVVMDCFKEPFDRNGKPGLTLACYEAVNAK